MQPSRPWWMFYDLAALRSPIYIGLIHSANHLSIRLWLLQISLALLYNINGQLQEETGPWLRGSEIYFKRKGISTA